MSDAAVEARVAGRRFVADGVVELRLATAATAGWAPGAHVDLCRPDGAARPYSLCGPPGAAELTVAVLREDGGRGFSRWVHDELQVGSTVRIHGPRNHFALVPAPRYLFIAGGIGITPILAMAREVVARGAPARIVYGGRSRASMAYAEEVAALGGELCPEDNTGLLDVRGLLGDPTPDTAVYCCGPAGLLEAVESAHADGWPAGSLHVERFTPADVDSSADVAFEVECALSGVVLPVPAGGTILEAVQRGGITVLSSCQEGTCGTCETVVLDGRPDHRDVVLSPQERAAGDVMMICCSRSLTPRLVLEL